MNINAANSGVSSKLVNSTAIRTLRACHRPVPRTVVVWRRKRQAKVTKCNPAEVVVRAVY